MSFSSTWVDLVGEVLPQRSSVWAVHGEIRHGERLHQRQEYETLSQSNCLAMPKDMVFQLEHLHDGVRLPYSDALPLHMPINHPF